MTITTNKMELVLLLILLALAHVSYASISPQTFAASLRERADSAFEWAGLEQEVEDWNALNIASATTRVERVNCRRLICLPLDERFDPPKGSFPHGHVQTGDKMSVPNSFYDAVTLSNAEVPWLFEVSRIEGVTGERVDVPEEYAAEKLESVVGGPIDFRAPDNYCFLPLWMMRALGLQPRDIVQVKLVQNVPAGSLVQLRPHSEKFSSDISNTQAVLETELKHYSSLTKGSTIAFDYNKQRYWFDVENLRSAPRGEKAKMIKVQDCDVATDFLPSKEAKNKKKQKDVEDS